MSDAKRYDCPKCGVKAGERCRTLNTGRTTDYHGARIDVWWDALKASARRRTPGGKP